MNVDRLLNEFECKAIRLPSALENCDILSLCHNSRNAEKGCMFFCRRGAVSDGHAYAEDAYRRGARFFVVEREIALPHDAAVILVDDASYALRRAALKFYGDPSKDIKLIGITGTKGKTTVALSVYEIAKENGINVGYIGTNGIFYRDQRFESANTTPDCLELQRTLFEMKAQGISVVILEVSSQALWQERTYGLSFDICAFTNLYEDHIGGVEHPDIDHYKNCKKKLFSDYNAKNIVINADCEDSFFMIDGVECDNIITTSANGNEKCDFFAKNAEKTRRGIRPGVSFRLFSSNSSPEANGGGIDAFIPVPGIYSIENGLITVAICSLLGIGLDHIISALSSLSISGRFETVELEGKPDSLFIIDYAHNGASLSAVLSSLREYEPRRIIVLFGSVGGRTYGRREELGVAAERGADVIVITSDNPDKEDPMKVVNDIYSYIKESEKEIFLIPDRAEAVAKAYELAEKGDFVLLAGKGHESYQLIDGKRMPFSERKILEETDALAPVGY